jgi:hypothetical protein
LAAERKNGMIPAAGQAAGRMSAAQRGQSEPLGGLDRLRLDKLNLTPSQKVKHDESATEEVNAQMEDATDTIKPLVKPALGMAAAKTMVKGVLTGKADGKLMEKVEAAISPDGFQEEEINGRFKDLKKLRREFDAKRLAVLKPQQKEQAKRMFQKSESQKANTAVSQKEPVKKAR